MKIDLIDIDRCAACGAEKVKGHVACSLFGAYTSAWCEECLRTGRDSYDQMVSYIADAGVWPNDINDYYQTEVHRQLKLHQKTEEEFKKDVDEVIKLLRDMPTTTYVILDSLGDIGGEF